MIAECEKCINKDETSGLGIISKKCIKCKWKRFKQFINWARGRSIDKVECEDCNDKGEVPGLGMIPKNCTKCKWKRRFKQFINWILGNPFKTHPIHLACSLFLLIPVIWIFNSSILTFNILLGIFGIIFVALKYKLDQASYHKALFEKRYEIFSVIDEILKEWGGNQIVTNDMLNKINRDLMRKSYFLFGQNTYGFINEFRSSLTYHQSKGKEATNSNQLQKKVDDAEKFLVSFVDRQNLSDKFPELKINMY
jgi:hypothetical protein